MYENHIALFAPFLQEHCCLHELEQKEIEKDTRDALTEGKYLPK